MQQLLSSMVVAISLQDAAYTTGMAEARKNAAQTGQQFEKSADQMESALERAARSITRTMVSISDAMAAANRKIIATGAAMTIGLTVPLAMAGKSAKDTASTFEAAMNNVRAALLKESPEQIEKLSEAAMQMGPKFGKSASEAAAAIEALGKTNLSAAEILGGALESALTLAVVGQTDLGRATAITTDIMAQFGKKAADLPGITDRVVGALDATKMGADDYAQAIGQVGGIAGRLGYAFEDTNVAIAALSTSFDSGSSAGTALKSMLLQLKPTTESAKDAFERVGKATTGTTISFFDANNKAKSFAETAEILRNTFGRLNEESKREALTKAFGSDGMAAALALIDKGAAGMDRLGQSIDGVTAKEKLAVMMQGDAAASQRLSSAIETLSIKIGNILLPIFTAVKNAAADMVNWLANLPPIFHYAAAAVGGLAAMMGPLTVALGVVAKVAIPLLLARFAVVPVVIGLIINPLGLLIGLIGRLAIAMGASAAIAMFGARFLAFAGPIGLVVSLISILIPLMMQTGAAAKAQEAATAKLAETQTETTDATNRLATATGKGRDEAIKYAQALRAQRIEALGAAKAQLDLLRVQYRQARVSVARIDQHIAEQGHGTRATASERAARMAVLNEQRGLLQAQVDLTSGLINQRNELDAALKAPPPGAGGGISVDFSDPGKGQGAARARDRAETARRNDSRYEDELGRLRVAALEAQAELTGSIEARHRADVAAIEEERAAFERNIALDEGLDEEKRKALMLAQKEVLARRKQQADQDRSVAIERDRYDLQLAILDAQREEVRSQIDAADSAAGRRAGQLRLLELDRRYEDAVLDKILATEKTTSIEYSNALAQKDQLDAIYAERATAARRDTAGPLETYRRELNRSAAAVNESIEAIQVSGFEKLNDWMADAAMGADNLAKSFSDMALSIVRDLMKIVIQQQLIKPLAAGLTGEGGGSGFLSGLFGGLRQGGAGGLVEGNAGPTIGQITPMIGGGSGGGFFRRLFGSVVGGGLSFGGGKASGGKVSPGSWYMVGERGPEPFIPESAGTILPTSAMRGGGGGVARVEIVEHEGFASRVVGISGKVSVQTTRANNRRADLRARQRLA